MSKIYRPLSHAAQRGFSMIEGLIGLLIFAIGLLGVAGLYSTSVQQVTSAEFRTTAAMLANDLIGRMWMSDRTYSTLQASYSSADAGTGYTSWKAAVLSSSLPSVTTYPPTVVFTTVAGGGSSAVNSSLATITIYWKAPGDDSVRQYVALTQMKP